MGTFGQNPLFLSYFHNSAASPIHPTISTPVTSLECWLTLEIQAQEQGTCTQRESSGAVSSGAFVFWGWCGVHTPTLCILLFWTDLDSPYLRAPGGRCLKVFVVQPYYFFFLF